MKIGEQVTVNGVTGKLLEIIELENEKRIKLEMEQNKIAIITYHKPAAAGLGTMKLG
jgi:hypothetical protein